MRGVLFSVNSSETGVNVLVPVAVPHVPFIAAGTEAFCICLRGVLLAFALLWDEDTRCITPVCRLQMFVLKHLEVVGEDFSHSCRTLAGFELEAHETVEADGELLVTCVSAVEAKN